ncbi:MAG: hypothetical protein PHG95_00060 [Patescibacteria group bacterium]|nr:hypothetical protein [Patescibacteria group bacterium]
MDGDSLNQEDKPASELSAPPLLLCLFLDGLGVAPATEFNAVTAAKLPNLFKYVRDYPVTLLSGKTKDASRRYWSLGCGRDDDDPNFLEADTCLSELIAAAGKRQLKIVASEQLLGFSLFFNNYREQPFGGEDIVCFRTPAPEEILRPLSREIYRALDKAIHNQTAPVIFASLPLAHESSARGDFKETVNSLQQIDKLLPKIINPVINAGGLVIITSAFGNAERTRDLAADWEDREPTANPVPFLLIGYEYQGKTIGLADPLDGDLSVLAPAGTLADFAPTVLHLLGIDKPDSMTGESLI